MQNAMLSLTISCIENQKIDIDEYQKTSADISTKDGKFYSGMPPGGSIFAVPSYCVAKLLYSIFPKSFKDKALLFLHTRNYIPDKHILHSPNPLFFIVLTVCTSICAIVFSSMAVVWLYEILEYYHTSSQNIILVYAFAIGSPFLGYGAGFYTQSLGTAFLLLSYRLFIRYQTELQKKYTDLLQVGFFLACAVTCDYPFFIYAGCLGGIFLLRSGIKGFIWICLGGMLPGVLLAYYHNAAFGAFIHTPYHFRVRIAHNTPTLGLTLPDAYRLWERFFSWKDGIILSFPLCVFLPYSIIKRPQGNIHTLEIYSWIAGVCSVLAYVLCMGWAMSSDAGLGSRYFVPAIPFICFLAMHADAISPLYQEASTICFSILAFFGIAWHLIGSSLGSENISCMLQGKKFLCEFGSFTYRNIAQHLITIPSWSISGITLIYVGCIAVYVYQTYKKMYSTHLSKQSIL